MAQPSITCRSCAYFPLTPILSLGLTPLANSLLTDRQLTQPEPRYPLDLVFCPDCSLVQITESVPPEALFTEYLYFSSFAETMLRHAALLTERIRTERKLGPDSLVVEIASNDGYLLQFYKRAGIPVLGIEPAKNIAAVARQKGIDTLEEFFGAELGSNLAEQGRRADVIHAHNVLAHVSDLNGVVEGMASLLKPDGVAVIEVPYVKEMVDCLEFDTIYHEHLCYFSFTSLLALFGRHGLTIVDVERVEIHGGSLRIWVARSASGQRERESVRRLADEEQKWGASRFEFYSGFGARVQELRDSLRKLLTSLKRQGQSIAAYGASAKGSTLLNYCGIGRETLDYVVDRSTVKQGRYTPGARLPIYPPGRLLDTMPEYVLLLTWNFADEILEQQQEYLDRGGHFIIPVPEVRVLP